MLLKTTMSVDFIQIGRSKYIVIALMCIEKFIAPSSFKCWKQMSHVNTNIPKHTKSTIRTYTQAQTQTYSDIQGGKRCGTSVFTIELDTFSNKIITHILTKA